MINLKPYTFQIYIDINDSVYISLYVQRGSPVSFLLALFSLLRFTSSFTQHFLVPRPQCFLLSALFPHDAELIVAIVKVTPAAENEEQGPRTVKFQIAKGPCRSKW